ncbi:MAG: NAD(+) synthase, partial [Clostridia bacterium]|nr:NAD(+) synthase [Clostridia bacterium]
MKHGFIKVAAANFDVSIANCKQNADKIIDIAVAAYQSGAQVVVFPELSLTGCTCGDLFFSRTLHLSVERELCRILQETASTDTIIIVSFPFLVNDKIYNCSAFCQKGQILGIIPKSILNFSEQRYFSVYSGEIISIRLGDDFVVFGNNLIFSDMKLSSLKIGIEIGSEAFARISPSCRLCELGATVILNPFSSPELLCAEEYRSAMLSSLSARNICGYVHTGAGNGESTTDGVFGGYCAIYENGKLLTEKPALSDNNTLLITEIDVELISHERQRNTGFTTQSPSAMQQIFFELDECENEITRKIPSSPFIPENISEMSSRCKKTLTIQAKGLAQRIKAAHAQKCVIGISGGLDSCLALLVAARAMDILSLPRENIIAVTMPCFGTTQRTKTNAELLCSELCTTFKTVDIGNSVIQHFKDIQHDESNRNVVYENAQARERTQVIMDIANMENAIVVGTGDLSELVLGWATYNGDHMSMYGVNGGVPKTFIRCIVSVCADIASELGKSGLANVLRDILDT